MERVVEGTDHPLPIRDVLGKVERWWKEVGGARVARRPLRKSICYSPVGFGEQRGRGRWRPPRRLYNGKGGGNRRRL